MKNEISTVINVKENKVGILRVNGIDYISLTDLDKYKNSNNPSDVIKFWMSNKNSIDFYSLWEEFNNKDFNSVELHRIKINEVGCNRFIMTPDRWKKELESKVNVV